MLVGPAGAGKSAVAECLAAALTELGTKHVIWRMNPKVCHQLLASRNAPCWTCHPRWLPAVHKQCKPALPVSRSL